ncbi:MAG: hypothetical protein A2078_14990 [Nitrospirae bacterium GWC2_57_9]|nr:MAG: hypothetical protein A2078_14990 [Nitrospirae bacterium GWC2_57_9]
MKKKHISIAVAVIAVAVISIFMVSDGLAAGGKVTPTTNLIVGRPAKGMYCADPAGWINQGYKVYVWGDATPVKAQVFDANGILITPATGVSFTIPGTGQTGAMTMTDTANKVYTASPTSLRADMLFTGDSIIRYTADGKTFDGVVRRWNSKCDGCHATPPAHALANAGSAGNSTCRSTACHADFGALMMQSHGYRVPVAEQTTSEGCYRCHPSPCYSGIHKDKFPNDSIGCVTCHGTMIDAANGQMKVPGQLGFPTCQDCHVSADPRVQPVPYATNTGVQYKSSVGHGRTRAAKALCITCHNSMHMETKPTAWGDGVNNNCSKCHQNMPSAGNMGPVCGNCHENSFDPHLVIK